MLTGMYVPAHFAATDADVHALLGSAGAVDLITAGPDGLVATLLPMLWDPDAGEHGVLLGHVARNNPHWRLAGPSLVIARGPDAYISPSWYASKDEHGRVVPTWNYLSVHLQGRLVVHDDPEWLRALVTRLTEMHEAGQDRPWSVADAPAAFINGQLRAIVGLEFVVENLQAKAKLSQNRPEADQDGVIAALPARGPAAAAVAEQMLSRRR
jgi:transcriptional regulator